MTVPGENPVLLHVIDIQVKDIQRKVFGPVAAHEFFGHGVRIVAPAALLISQRPLRRHGQVAGEIRVAS